MRNRIWFTADTHFGHDNIIRYCKRPFSSSDEMDSAIISRFNEVLRPGDTLYHLGDIAWSTYPIKEFFNSIRGVQVHLIRGNHDPLPDTEYRKYCAWVGEYKKITIGSVGVCLFHYPMRSWVSKGRGGFQLYGHCHGSLEPGLDRSMDIGVDTHNFYPWSWEEVYQTLASRPVFSAQTKQEFES